MFSPSIFEDAHENTEIIRSIARTIPQIFWIKPYQPPTSRYSLREVVKEIRASSKNEVTVSPLQSLPSSLRETFSLLT